MLIDMYVTKVGQRMWMWLDGLVKNLEILVSCDMTITVLSPFTFELRIYLKQARSCVNKLQKDAMEAKAVGNNSKNFFILTVPSIL